MGAGEGFTKGQCRRKFYFSRVSDRGTRDEAEASSDTWDQGWPYLLGNGYPTLPDPIILGNTQFLMGRR